MFTGTSNQFPGPRPSGTRYILNVPTLEGAQHLARGAQHRIRHLRGNICNHLLGWLRGGLTHQETCKGFECGQWEKGKVGSCCIQKRFYVLSPLYCITGSCCTPTPPFAVPIPSHAAKTTHLTRAGPTPCKQLLETSSSQCHLIITAPKENQLVPASRG